MWNTTLTPVVKNGRVSYIVGSSHDITDRKRAEQRLQRSEKYNRSIVELIPDILVHMSREGVYLDIVASSDDDLLLPTDELLHRTVVDVLGEETGNRIMSCIEKALDTDRLQTIEYPLHVSEGDAWFEARIVPSGEDRVFALIRNVTQRKRSEQRIRYLSFHDSLTGLYNRAFAEQEMNRLGVARQLPLSIIMADVNGLKMVNDSLGHADGDALLREAAAAFLAACRSEDIVARWGGDEFLVVLPQTAANEVDRIVRRIARECSTRKSDSIPVSLAMGSATKERPDQGLNDLLREAENRMYRRKRRGRRATYHDNLTAILAEMDRQQDHKSSEYLVRLGAMVRELEHQLDQEEAVDPDASLIDNARRADE